MRRILLIILVILCTVNLVYSQDASKLLVTFKRNFAIASLDVKLQILQDAANTGSIEMGPLYLQAIEFVLDNASFIQADIRFRQLAIIALTQITEIGYSNARDVMWDLFRIDEDTTTRVTIMNALSNVVDNEVELIEKMNAWIDSQNTIFKTGKIPDLQVVAACIDALGNIGHPSSFPIIFSAMNLGYSEKITNSAREALLIIQGDFRALLVGILRDSPLPEKKQAY